MKQLSAKLENDAEVLAIYCLCSSDLESALEQATYNLSNNGNQPGDFDIVQVIRRAIEMLNEGISK